MARVIEGDPQLFNALLYGENHPGTTQFISNQIENASNMLTQAGQQFFEGGKRLFDQLQNSNAMRMAKMAKRAIGGMWQVDEVRPLTTMGEFQHAPSIMRRYIMVNPVVRKMFVEQRIAGYDGSYVDPYPEDDLENHYDHRRVMNGVIVDDDENDWSSTTYYDTPMEGDSESLDFADQIDIIDSWGNIVDLIRKGGEDPTSLFCSDL